MSSCHKFSIGFASGDFGGQSNSVTSCWRSHCLVDRDVWIGALSCWKTKSSPINAAASASMCSSRTCWYDVLSERPSSFTRDPTPCQHIDPTPCQHIDPHTITLAACWTVRSQHSGRNSSPLRRQTYRAPSFPMLTFDSSVKKQISSHPKFIVCECLPIPVANAVGFLLAVVFLGLRAFTHVLLRRRRTVLLDTCLPVLSASSYENSRDGALRFCSAILFSR